MSGSKPSPKDQIPFAPCCGFLAVIEGDPYPVLPRKPLARWEWALKAPVGHTGAKLLLVALAYHANDHGRAWPSIATLARMTGSERRSAFQRLEWLVKNGWLARVPRNQRSTIFYPKAPSEWVCATDGAGCGYRSHEALSRCPACGQEPLIGDPPLLQVVGA